MMEHFFSKAGGLWTSTLLEMNSIGQVLERTGELQSILYFTVKFDVLIK